MISTVFVLSATLLVSPQTTTFGSLERATRALEAALDTYRLGMLEVHPALERVYEQGLEPGSRPDLQISHIAQNTFVRLHRSIRSRVPYADLDPISRSYHEEAIGALEEMALAETIGAVGEPAKLFHRALSRLLEQGRHMIDLYSRTRPALIAHVDPDSVLDEILVAQDALAAAEARVVQTQKDELPEQLKSLMRLEIALRRVLDLIAAAEESGLELGFRSSRPVLKLKNLAATLGARLLSFKKTSESFDGQLGDAYFKNTISFIQSLSEELKVDIFYNLIGSAPLVRIEGRLDREKIEKVVYHELRGEGFNDAQASQAASQATQNLDFSWRLVGEQPSGRGQIVDTIPWQNDQGPWALEYRIIAVNAYNAVLAETLLHPIELPDAKRESAFGVYAEAPKVAPGDRAHYLLGDAVSVHWLASPADHPLYRLAKESAPHYAWPQQIYYEIWRTSGETKSLAGRVPAGVNHFVDHPSLDMLAEGIYYQVRTLSDRSAKITRKRENPSITLDLRPDFALAQNGLVGNLKFLPWLQRKSREWEERLSNIPSERWATDLPDATPIYFKNLQTASTQDLYDEYRSPGGLAPGDFSQSRKEEAYLSAFLEQSDPIFVDDVERYWSLLPESWQNRAAETWVRRHHPQDRGQARALLKERSPKAWRGARIWAWWTSRDAQERDVLKKWAAQQKLEPTIQKFVNMQAKYGIENPHLVAWEELGEEEREAFHAGEWPRASIKALAEAQAFWEFSQLDLKQQQAAVKESRAWSRGLYANLRYHYRHLDRLVSFRAWTLFIWPMLLLILLIYLKSNRSRP